MCFKIFKFFVPIERCCSTEAGGIHTDLGNGYCKNPENIKGGQPTAKAACEAVGATLAQLTTANDQADFEAAAGASRFFRGHGAWWLGIEKDSDGNWKVWSLTRFSSFGFFPTKGVIEPSKQHPMVSVFLCTVLPKATYPPLFLTVTV